MSTHFNHSPDGVHSSAPPVEAGPSYSEGRDNPSPEDIFFTPPSSPRADPFDELRVTQNQNFTLNSEDFSISNKIGKGGFGQVFKAQRKKDGEMVAIKVLQKHDEQGVSNDPEILDEVKILQRVGSSPFIVDYHGWYNLKNEVHLVFQLYPFGDLFSVVKNNRGLTEDQTRLFTSQIGCALHHLHSNDIIFRDLKLSNVLVLNHYHVVLTDFGMAKHVPSGDADSICGTTYAMAPEMLEGRPYTIAVDWWALGVMIYEMLTCEIPFDETTDRSMETSIISTELQFPPGHHLSTECQDLIFRLLIKEPEARITAVDELTEHPFYDRLFDEKGKS